MDGPRPKPLAGRFGLSLASLLLALMMAGLLVYGAIMSQLPDVAHLTHVSWQTPLRVVTQEGKLIAQFGEKQRLPVPLSSVPNTLIHAVLATEDQRFYDHGGVDIMGLMRAAKAVLSSGRKVQGASTITMQVARNFFLSREKTYVRKLKEIVLALQISQHLSKDQVLSLYLNKIYFGQRAYGVAAAARNYYGRRLDQLTLPQMAMLAGLPKAPSGLNPTYHPVKALARRNHVLERMRSQGYISEAAYQAALKTPLTAGHFGPRVVVHAPYVAEMVRRVLVGALGPEAYAQGLTVVTTLRAHLQEAANRALHRGLMRYDRQHGWRRPSMNLAQGHGEDLAAWRQALNAMPTVNGLVPAVVLDVDDANAHLLLGSGQVHRIQSADAGWAVWQTSAGHRRTHPRPLTQLMSVGDVVHVHVGSDGAWHLAQLPQVQGALVAMERHSGRVLALVGGWSYALSHFNRVTQAWRQPGSCIKPFIYSAALSQGLTLATVINDAPIVLKDSGENAYWRPSNAGLRFQGPTRLREGLIHSRNLVSIRLLRRIGVQTALAWMAHFHLALDKQPHSLSLALGAGLVTPWQLNAGMAVFAQEGAWFTPQLIAEVLDASGKALDVRGWPLVAVNSEGEPLALHPERAIPTDNAYLMDNVLRSVITSGTGRAAKALGRKDLAGKTGTTNDRVDAWFSGYGGPIVATVWVGYDDSRSVHAYGSQVALPIWMQFMRRGLRDQAEYVTPRPSGLVDVRIDRSTGQPALEEGTATLFELFRQDHAPAAVRTTVPVTQDPTNGDAERGHSMATPGPSSQTEPPQGGTLASLEALY